MTSIVAHYTHADQVSRADWPDLAAPNDPPLHIRGDVVVDGAITEGGLDVAAASTAHRAAPGSTPESGSVALAGSLVASSGISAADSVVSGSLHVASFASVTTLVAVLGTGTVGIHLVAGAHNYKVVPLGKDGTAGPVSNTASATVPSGVLPSHKRPVIVTWSLPAGHIEPQGGWAIYQDTNLLITGLTFDVLAPHTFTDDGTLTANASLHPPVTNTTGALTVDGALAVGGALSLEGALAVSGAAVVGGDPVVVSRAVSEETVTPDHTVVLVINGVSVKVPAVLL